jgi:DNA repair exonuclease SbcCD ATPase subunit
LGLRDSLYAERKAIDDGAIFGRISKEDSKRMAEIDREIMKINSQLSVTEERLDNINKKEAQTGKKSDISEKVNAVSQKRLLAEKERTKILEDIAKLEDDIARKKRSAFENEIHDIKQVRSEYEKNIQTLIDNAKAQKELAKTDDRKKMLQSIIDSLEKRKNTGLADYDNQIKEAQKKEQERIKKTWDTEKNYVAKQQAQNAFDEKRRLQDEGFEGLLSGGKFADAIKAITTVLKAEENIYANLVTDRDKLISKFSSANSEAGVKKSEKEDEILKANQAAIDSAFARKNDLRRKLREAYAAAEDVQQRDNVRSIGNFSAAVLSKALAGDGDAADQTAQNTKKTVDLLKAIKQNTATAKDYKQVYN